MRNRQGTRRVYLKENNYEPPYVGLPSRLFTSLYGPNTWAWTNTHPGAGVYEPWNSQYHQGNMMEFNNPAAWDCAISTRTGTKVDSTVYPYVDPNTGDGGLEPVIFEFKINLNLAGDLTFLFAYTAATNQGYGIRVHAPGGVGTTVIEVVSVNNVAAPPVYGVLASHAIADQVGEWRCVRVYLNPSDLKYGGSTLTAAGQMRIFISDGDPTEMPHQFLEGVNIASASTYNFDTGDFIIGSIPVTGDSLGWLSAPGSVGMIGTTKYCRHWDYAMVGMYYMNRMTIGWGFINLNMPKPINEKYDTAQDAQIGYEYGDRIELQIKDKGRTYADPPVEYERTSIIDFDGAISNIKNAGGGGERVDITATCFYGQLLRWYEHITFIATSTLLAAFQTIGPTSYKYQNSPMNGYGLDPALGAITFAGAKDYKGLSTADIVRRLCIFSNAWSTWHPEGTWVVSTLWPQDVGHIIDPNDATWAKYILKYHEVQQGQKVINNVDFYSPLAGTVNSQDAGSYEFYTPHGSAIIDSRESNAADMATIAGNIVNAWKYRRRLIDIYIYGGAMGDVRIGDLVTLIFEGLDIPAPGTKFQLIQKMGAWGERFPTTSNVIVFRFCEYIDATTPSIFYIGKGEEFLEMNRTGRNALAQHA